VTAESLKFAGELTGKFPVWRRIFAVCLSSKKARPSLYILQTETYVWNCGRLAQIACVVKDLIIMEIILVQILGG